MSKLAILSVFDKTGIAPFAQALEKLGITILSTGGTSKHLKDAGVGVKSISEYTGHPEILEGRVKSLHPKIHGGILSRRSREDDMSTLAEHEILPVDFVVVNLYPFTQKVAEVVEKGDVAHPSLVEDIDIGGPTMIRAAAKNCEFVVPVCDPADYDKIIAELKDKGEVSQELRKELAAKVFAMTARYDAAIARYFSLGEKLLDDQGELKQFAPFESLTLEREQVLRYGENPHQSAALYRHSAQSSEKRLWTQLQGKELSYNNLVDMQGSLDLFLELYRTLGNRHAAVAIKHTNPCGVAVRDTALEAFTAARQCDPVSIFGGIIAVSGEVDEELAGSILEQFVELVLVEKLTDGAKSMFAKKKNLRLIECDFKAMADAELAQVVKVIGDRVLLQDEDPACCPINPGLEVTGTVLDDKTLADLKFAWIVAKYVKSNTIVIAKDEQAIGVGAGQMSRVDAARIAIERAKLHGFSVDEAVAASDAFLPFPDTLEVLNDAGVKALVQPGGSVKDDTVIEAAKSRQMNMLFTGERHFRH